MRILLSVLVLASASLFASGVARADVSSCVDASKTEARECRDLAREASQVAKDGCVQRDHACVEICRADREDCVETSQIAADLAICQDERAAAVEACRNTTPDGSAERDTCIDVAQLAAFVCRDGAREANRGELRTCRNGFRACARACGPAPVPGGARECRNEARLEFAAAREICQVEKRIAVDACRHLDHACVEQCRDDRDACREPIDATLEAAIDVCRSTRDEAVAVCRATTADDSPERDACVDAAQLANFQCRDTAREAARPSFAVCRAEFPLCVQACPPPAP